MRKFSNKKIAAVALTAMALTGTGVAYAYWTTTGSGSGTATTNAGSAAQLKVNQLAAPANALLAPGQPGGTLSGNVQNLGATTAPNYAVEAVKITLSVTPAASPPAGTCDATDYLIKGATGFERSAYVPATGVIVINLLPDGDDVDLAGGATTPWTSTLSFVNKDSNQDACKGATVNLAYETVQS
jgi:hypothetical protein